MYRMEADRMLPSIFNNQPEENRFRGRSRNHWLNFLQADLKKYLLKEDLPTDTAEKDA